MQSLGLEDMKPKRATEPASGLASGAKKKRKMSASAAAARSAAAAFNLPVRRSTRATAAPEFFDPQSADSDGAFTGGGASGAAANQIRSVSSSVQRPLEIEETYEDSGVLTYLVDGSNQAPSDSAQPDGAKGGGGSLSKPSKPDSEEAPQGPAGESGPLRPGGAAHPAAAEAPDLSSFARPRDARPQALRQLCFASDLETLSDGTKGKWYGLDMDPQSGLLAAGGQGGRVSLFKIKAPDAAKAGKEKEEEEEGAPILSFKPHGSTWVSDVKFCGGAEGQGGGGALASRLLTAANDG